MDLQTVVNKKYHIGFEKLRSYVRCGWSKTELVVLYSI